MAVTAFAQTPVLTYENIDLSAGPMEIPAEDASIIIGMNAVTIVVEANITNTSDASVAFGAIKNYNGTMSANNDILALGVGNNQMRFYVGNGSGQYYSRGSATTGNHCLACTLSENDNEKLFWDRVQLEPSANKAFNTSTLFSDFTGESAKFYIGGIKNSTSTWGAFNGTIYSVRIYEGALSAEEMAAIFSAEKDAAKSFVDDFEGKVGYPDATAVNNYIAAIDAAKITKDFEEPKSALYTSTSINMPIDGKAYTFKNVQKDGKTFFFKFDAANGITLSENPNDAEIFVCRKKIVGTTEKYVFVNNSGKYFTHKGGSYTGPNENKGYTDSYDQTDNKFFNDFSIVKLLPGNVTTSGNNDQIAVTNELLFGCVGLCVKRNDRNEDVYYIIKKDNGFDQASGPFVRHNLTSMIKIEEAQYSNTPKLNAITGDLINFDGAIATFSAPFATVVPEGVTAYYAAANGGNYISLEPVNGAVPANEGVILVGPEVGNVTMVPAAGEQAATIENNLLGHSAGAAKIMNGGYILTGGASGVGFYACSGGTLAMNKSYLDVETGTSLSVELRLPGTTAVEAVDCNDEESIVYDLQGRRVNGISDAGIYIVNGKKVLVK